MLPLLSALVSCEQASDLTWAFVPGYTFNLLKADFEIFYKGIGTSFSNYGWWPVVKEDNGPEIPILGRYNGTARTNNLFISTEITRVGLDYLLIQFIAKNNGHDPHKVSIASWTDVHLFDDDWASVYWYDGNRGLTMSNDRWSNHEKIKLTLVVRDGYGVTNVDNFWFGLQQAYKYHYWDDRKDTRDFTEGDSAFSFGWKDREIYPNQTLKFGVLFGVAENLMNPPIITASLSQVNYPSNYTVIIPVNIKDFDKNDRVTLYYNTTVNNVTKKYISKTLNTGNGLNANVDVSVKLGTEVGALQLKIWAEDSYGIMSNEFTANLLVNEAPSLILTNQIKPKYNKNGAIEIQGSIWDETYAYIYYQIDDSYKFSPREAVHCNRNQTSFRQILAIQDKNIDVGNHVLKIWAVDEFGAVSQNYSYKFEYVNQQIPEIRINQTEIENFSENQYINVVGEVRDVDSIGLLTIYYLPANAEASEMFQNVDVVPATFEWSNFSFIYQVPKMNPGLKHLTFKVHDNTEANSFYAYYNFTYVANETDDINITATHNEQNGGFNGLKTATIRPPEKKKLNYILIVALVGAAVLVLAIIIAVVVIYREAKKEPETFNEDNAVFLNTNGGVDVETDNPLYGKTEEADPFKNDFEASEESSVFLTEE